MNVPVGPLQGAAYKPNHDLLRSAAQMEALILCENPAPSALLQPRHRLVQTGWVLKAEPQLRCASLKFAVAASDGKEIWVRKQASFREWSGLITTFHWAATTAGLNLVCGLVVQSGLQRRHHHPGCLADAGRQQGACRGIRLFLELALGGFCISDRVQARKKSE